MVADLEIFKRLYLFSFTSYSIITGITDFPFTEQCYTVKSVVLLQHSGAKLLFVMITPIGYCSTAVLC